jgi:Uri superfamily endonuclease
LPGQYGYIGSAFGPGGIHARVRHHLLPSPKPHWHLDYVKPYVEWTALGWSVNTTRFECRWIQQLIQLDGISIPIPGFGASDCRQGCPAHFFQYQQEPDILFEFLNIRSHFYFMYNKADF